MDTCAGGGDGGPANEGRVAQSTISRFACRILADRSEPRIARIYAAGFDSSRNIFLGVRFEIYDLLCYKLRYALWRVGGNLT